MEKTVRDRVKRHKVMVRVMPGLIFEMTKKQNYEWREACITAKKNGQGPPSPATVGGKLKNTIVIGREGNG